MKRRSKKALSLLLSVSILAGLIPVGAQAEDECGYCAEMSMHELYNSGSAAVSGACYSIASRREFEEFTEYVNSGLTTENVSFYLKKDIELKADDEGGNNLSPIGSELFPFAGIFDGCGFAVTGIDINEAENDAALFSYVSGVIKNLGVTGRVIGNLFVAGIAAHLTGRIINSWSNVEVNGSSCVGSVAGIVSDGRIENCCAYSKSSGGAIAGRLAENAACENCYYAYYCAESGAKTADSGASADIHRFASSPTMCVAENKLNIGNASSEDITVLLNAWADINAPDEDLCCWCFDTSEAALSRVGGRYPMLEYPGYVVPEEEKYTANMSMSTLYDTGMDAEKGSYYSISDAPELAKLSEFVAEGHSTEGATFFLTSDMSIIASQIHFKGNYSESAWKPIGLDSATPFKGVFDGQGFIITELLADGSNKNVGLFGYVCGADAVIKNVGVAGVISGGENSGGIVGYLEYGKVINSWYSGTVEAKRASGGIVGYANRADIVNCVCYGTAGGSRDFGGIVGTATASTNIRFTYYSSENTLAVGSSSGNVYLAVTFRLTDGEYMLNRSVKITEQSTVRLINALNYWVDSGAGSGNYRYWRGDISVESTARARGSFPVHIYFGERYSPKYTEETEAETDSRENPYNIVYNPVSSMTELYMSKADAVRGGSYSISNGDEMWLLSMFVEEGYSTKDADFFLTDDIYLANQGIGHGGAGWVPVGTGVSIDFQSTSTTRFLGDFDGCGYTVYGLYIVSDFLDFAGLFGRCKGSTIKNLGVCGDILADDEVGGIVGRLEDGEIINCWSAVNIQCSTELGGICGHLVDSRIENCANYGILITTLDEHEDSGGIVGSSFGDCEIKNSYYLFRGSDAMSNSLSTNTVVDNVYYFNYDLLGDQSCTLQNAYSIQETTSDDLLTMLNTWVYVGGSDQYCSWQISSSLMAFADTKGFFPILAASGKSRGSTGTDYCGDYTATAGMTELYSTRSDGIVGGCYSISTLEDLVAFRKYVNDGFKTKDRIFFLAHDIDLSSAYSAETGQSWIPIGTVKDPFKGVFDGQGYTVKYLYIVNTEDDQALFGHVAGMDALIKNLGVGGGTVITKGVNSAGIVADLDFATIANCWCSCYVGGAINVGGIAGGCNMGFIINCANYGAVVGASTYGAIAGAPIGTVMNYCYFCYATTQIGFPLDAELGGVLNVTYFNGTRAVCVLNNPVKIAGVETRNVLSALKLYVDAHPETNYCYWSMGTTKEYYLMAVTDFPVLISASNTMGEKDLKTVQAVFDGREYTSLSRAVAAANESEGGGTVELLVNVVLSRTESVTMDEDVSLDTGEYTLVIKTFLNAEKLSKLKGMFIVKDGGYLALKNGGSEYKPFILSKKSADPSCGSVFYGTKDLTFTVSPDDGDCGLSLHDGEFTLNSSLDSGNPHALPAGSVLTVEENATLIIGSNARLRTVGSGYIDCRGGLRIGNAALDLNGGTKLVGVLEDSDGFITLPYIYRDGYTMRGFTDGRTLYKGGEEVDARRSITLTAAWQIGDGADPYPGDEFFNDDNEVRYDIPINVIQTAGGSISPSTMLAAKGQNIVFKTEPKSGYYLKSLIVDGVPCETDENGSFVLASVSSSHTVTALFAQIVNNAFLTWQNSFEDIPEDYWCNINVRYAVSAGLFNGVSETVFSPTRTMTREMVVTVLWRLSGEPVVPGTKYTFTDVSETSYAYEAIRWGSYFGIVNGFSETEFGYGVPVNRQQLVSFLFRYAKNYVGEDVSRYDSTNILKYSDAIDIGKGMSQAFQWAIGAGYISGTSDTALSPLGPATRAQVAVIISRFCNKNINKIQSF